jgi:hypothetical protein
VPSKSAGFSRAGSDRRRAEMGCNFQEATYNCACQALKFSQATCTHGVPIMNRRRFTFWLGFGLFSLSEKFGLNALDSLAAAAMRHTESVKSAAAKPAAEHWTVGGSKEWQWFERENYIHGEWVLTGTTTPVNKKTGERKPENIGYIDDSLVPADVRTSVGKGIDLVGHEAPTDAKDGVVQVAHQEGEPAATDHEHAAHVVDLDPQLPTDEVRGRHGRPPSKWLRSLHADEIRIWLKTIRVPEAGVSGMTVWTHLTRDHYFDAQHIEGLTEPEEYKLHAAAHYGY